MPAASIAQHKLAALAVGFGASGSSEPELRSLAARCLRKLEHRGASPCCSHGGRAASIMDRATRSLAVVGEVLLFE